MAAIPAHLGVIPDGNRRWAREHGLPTLEGHRRGLDAAKEAAQAAFDRGVRYFTLYAFSTENWTRTQEEVGYLMNLFYGLLKNEFDDFAKRGIRLRVLGRRNELPGKLVKAIEEAEARTARNTAGTVSWCLNYGGQAELADALKSLVAAGVSPDEITPELINEHLYGPDVPPVDLVIRTSGEHRLSGFMLWRVAYAEFYFYQKNWPDFSVADLNEALDDFAQRQRRFGA